MNRLRTIIGLIIYFVFLIIAVILIHKSPARGYELSIYANTPLAVWLFLIGSFITGVIIVVREAFSREENNRWLIGLGILMITVFTVCALSALRSYYIYNTVDPLAHGGMAKDILMTGSIGPNNYYPWVHILIAQLSAITGIDVMITMKYLPAFFSILYMVSIYLLATLLLPTRGQRLLAAAASSAFLFEFFHTAIYAHSLATFMLLWFLYFYFRNVKSPSLVNKIPLVLIIVAMTFSHPVTAFFVIFFLVFAEIIKFIIRRRVFTNSNGVLLAKPGLSFNLAFIATAVFSLWYLSFALFQGRVRLAVEVVSGRKEEIVPYQVLNLPSTLQVGQQDLMMFFFRLYSPRLVYLLLAGVAMVIIFWLVVKYKHKLEGLMIIVTIIPISWAFTVGLYILTTSQSLTRLAMTDLLVLVSPILVGFLLYEFRENRHKFPAIFQRLAVLRKPLYSLSSQAGIMVILLFVIIMSIFTVYRSPYLYQTNWQATNADMQGLEWLVNYKKDKLLYNGLGLTHSLVHIYFGYAKSLEFGNYLENMMRVVLYGGVDIFDHFGYNLYDSIGERYADDAEERPGGPRSTYREYKYVRYMVITEAFYKSIADPDLSRRRVVGNWMLGGRWDFTGEDFQTLDRDPTVDKIYSSQGQDIYLLVPYGLSDTDPLFLP